MRAFLDFFLHFDKYFSLIFQQYGILTYFLLFLIIFAETGFVLTPFLPGDSLLFAAGAFSAKGSLNVYILFISISMASILGDTMNYWIGYHMGARVFEGNRFFKKEYLEKTKQFYVNHGKKTIVMARFIPIVRTFAPFVAGIGKMDYKIFLSYNIGSGIGWSGLFIFGGYFLGSLPWVEKNFSFFILAILLSSFFPMIFNFIRSHFKKRRSAL